MSKIKDLIQKDIARKRQEEGEAAETKRKMKKERDESDLKLAERTFRMAMRVPNEEKINITLREGQVSPDMDYYEIEYGGLDFKVDRVSEGGEWSPLFCWAPDQSRARGHWVNIERASDLKPWL